MDLKSPYILGKTPSKTEVNIIRLFWPTKFDKVLQRERLYQIGGKYVEHLCYPEGCRFMFILATTGNVF